jgi:hypothetical protein
MLIWADGKTSSRVDHAAQAIVMVGIVRADGQLMWLAVDLRLKADDLLGKRVRIGPKSFSFEEFTFVSVRGGKSAVSNNRSRKVHAIAIKQKGRETNPPPLPLSPTQTEVLAAQFGHVAVFAVENETFVIVTFKPSHQVGTRASDFHHILTMPPQFMTRQCIAVALNLRPNKLISPIIEVAVSERLDMVLACRVVLF